MSMPGKYILDVISALNPSLAAWRSFSSSAAVQCGLCLGFSRFKAVPVVDVDEKHAGNLTKNHGGYRALGERRLSSQREIPWLLKKPDNIGFLQLCITDW
jgi:hypothetical protein